MGGNVPQPSTPDARESPGTHSGSDPGASHTNACVAR